MFCSYVACPRKGVAAGAHPGRPGILFTGGHASGYTSLTCRLAPFCRDVFPLVETLNAGLNPSTAQFVTCNGTDSAAVAPSVLDRLPVMLIGLQFVGLNVNPGRLIVTLTCLICNGTPSRIGGIAYGPLLSLVIVSAAVIGSTSIFVLVQGLGGDARQSERR